MNRNAKVRTVAVASLALVLFAGSAVTAEKTDKAAKKRAEIDTMAAKALDDVLAKSPEAKGLYGKAFSAVFALALGVS